MSRRLKTGLVIGRMRRRVWRLEREKCMQRAERHRLDVLQSQFNSASHQAFMNQQTGLYNQLAAFAGTQAAAASQTQNPLGTLHSRPSEAGVNTAVQGSLRQLDAGESQETPQTGALARLATWLRARLLALKGRLS